MSAPVEIPVTIWNCGRVPCLVHPHSNPAPNAPFAPPPDSKSTAYLGRSAGLAADADERLREKYGLAFMVCVCTLMAPQGNAWYDSRGSGRGRVAHAHSRPPARMISTAARAQPDISKPDRE